MVPRGSARDRIFGRAFVNKFCYWIVFEDLNRAMIRKLFGTDGIRGTANAAPITADIALRVAQAAGVQFTRGAHRHRVVIGTAFAVPLMPSVPKSFRVIALIRSSKAIP